MWRVQLATANALDFIPASVRDNQIATVVVLGSIGAKQVFQDTQENAEGRINDSECAFQLIATANDVSK